MTYDDGAISRLLSYDTWAVVGLSDDPSRPAYGVAAFLQRHGKRVIPVHPAGGEVLGEKVWPSLRDVPEEVDVVDVFRRSSEAGAHADEAIEIGAKGVWFQVGVVDRAAYERVRAAGLDMVMDTCPKMEWWRVERSA
jgi:predicted CoA-binding protein